MTLLEVAKHALEAMEDAMYRADTHEFYDAKESLRYAIEQAEQAEQEPVVWAFRYSDGTYHDPSVTKHSAGMVPLYPYTAPTPRKPLTNAEIWNTYKNLWMFHPAEEPRLAGDVLKFARAIERAHGIGEQHES